MLRDRQAIVVENLDINQWNAGLLHKARKSLRNIPIGVNSNRVGEIDSRCVAPLMPAHVLEDACAKIIFADRLFEHVDDDPPFRISGADVIQEIVSRLSGGTYRPGRRVRILVHRLKHARHSRFADVQLRVRLCYDLVTHPAGERFIQP